MAQRWELEIIDYGITTIESLTKALIPPSNMKFPDPKGYRSRFYTCLDNVRRLNSCWFFGFLW